MAFTFSMKDTYRQSVEAASGGRQTVLYDDKGYPSIMDIIPKLTFKDVGIGSSNTVLPAFLVNGVEKSEIFIGTFPAYVHDSRAHSLPGQIPKVYTNHDQAVAYCRAKGKGWHCTTNAEYAAIALWCKKNGFYPRGNNNYGSDHSAPHETCRPGTKGSDGRTNLGITGSGPAAWTHDGTPNGIYGLNGDCWEWATGLRTKEGEFQIIPNNDAAILDKDLSASSVEWKAILEDGTLVAPGTANTLKIQPKSSSDKTPTIVKAVSVVTTDGTDDYARSQFKSMAVEEGISQIPDIMKALALYPSDDSDHGGDYFYARNNGERCFFRGGHWHNGASAGVFYLDGDNTRGISSGLIGFRAAYVSL